LAKHRIYQYTSIGRPLEPGYPTNRTVLILLPVAAVVGAVTAWMDGQAGLSILQQAFFFLLIVFGAWALARELDPDDHTAAFVSMGIAFIAALAIESPDILIVFTTLGLVRIVNRSTGLAARKLDSVIVMLLVFLVIYATESPLFGAVAALAYILDGSLKEPLRHQWIFAMICLGGTVVYMVDHNIGLVHMSAPDSLFEWLAVLFLLIFALNTLLLKKVHAKDDVNGRKLDIKRVRGGMAVGLFAALQGIDRPDSVVIILASIAGICIGMAFRKGFKAPASG
jgi:hypothetical protein